MKKPDGKKVAMVSVILSYGSMLGMVGWRMLRGKPAQPVLEKPSPAMEQMQEKLQAQEEKLLLPAPPVQEEKLESLSLSTPSDSALDRLARRSAFEEQEEALFMPGGGRADPKAPLPEGPGQPWNHESPVVIDLLRHQALETERLTGWTLPEPGRVPVPTFAPSVLAMGVVIFAMGLASSWYVCVVGAVIFAVAAWRWTGVLQGDGIRGD